MHLLQSTDDKELLQEKQKMMLTEKMDLQSLLSEDSSITEEEFIDTKRQEAASSGELEEISEPSQSQPKQRGRKRLTKPRKTVQPKFEIANNEEKISNSSTPLENEKLRQQSE